MLVSYNELKKYVDLDGLTPEDVANKLTGAGLEVEGVNRQSTATNLVFGKVLTCVPHPDSDHLHVTTVDIGSEVLGIVCGAPNVREGLKVIVAKVGAVLPGDKTITKGVIRGVESNGMLCSLVEIGVDPKYLKENQVHGIEEVDDSAKIGDTNVLEHFGLDDTILDINLLANRSDAYALYNVAKEVGALCSRKVTIPSPKTDKLVDNQYIISSKTEKCMLFATRVFKGIKVKESPKWLQIFLRNEGIRSINNIVDIGNYVMLLTGQPLNMYDADKLEDAELIVKDDFEGNVTAMDGNNYDIKNGDIVICSNNNVVCIAGVMTCENSKVTEETTNIVVESANFYGAQIRRTTTRLGLTSDSSQRFIKGINPHQTDEVMELTTKLLEELSGFESASKTVVFDKLNFEQKEIECTFDYINKRLGTHLSNEEILNALNTLYFETKNITKTSFVAVVPISRIDIEGKADLSEEVFRFVGVDSVEPTLPEMVTTVGGLKIDKKKEDVIADFLLNQGLDRVLTYTLTNKEDSELFNIVSENDGYVIFNANTEDHKFVRRNLLASVLRCAQYNYNHQNKNLGIFEISQINDQKGTSSHLAIVLCGNKFTQDRIGAIPYNFFDVKGYFEEILDLFNIQPNRVKYERMSDSKDLHPTRSCKATLDGKLLAVFGDIYPTRKKGFDFKNEPVILLEMNLNVLFETRSSEIHFVEVNKFPSVSRDYAFVVSKGIKFSDIKSEIKRSSSLISDIHVFDIYEGEHLERGLVSVALSVTIEAKDHTLKEEELTDVDTRIRSVISSKFNGVIRS